MRGAPTWAILAVALQMPAADSSYFVRVPADLCFVSAPSEACRYAAAQSMGFCNAATRVLDSRQAQKTCFRRGAPHHLYDSKAAMAIRDMDGGWRLRHSNVWPRSPLHLNCRSEATCENASDRGPQLDETKKRASAPAAAAAAAAAAGDAAAATAPSSQRRLAFAGTAGELKAFLEARKQTPQIHNASTPPDHHPPTPTLTSTSRQEPHLTSHPTGLTLGDVRRVFEQLAGNQQFILLPQLPQALEMLGVAAVSDTYYHNLRIQLRGVTICDEMTDQQYNQYSATSPEEKRQLMAALCGLRLQQVRAAAEFAFSSSSSNNSSIHLLDAAVATANSAAAAAAAGTAGAGGASSCCSRSTG